MYICMYVYMIYDICKNVQNILNNKNTMMTHDTVLHLTIFIFNYFVCVLVFFGK